VGGWWVEERKKEEREREREGKVGLREG